MHKKIILNNRFVLFISLIIFNGLILLIMQSLFHIRFEENDDVVMALISSGGYSGTPDPHLVFINVIYGYIVTALYSINSGIEWYSVLLLSLHTISASIIGTLILKSDNRLIIKKQKNNLIPLMYITIAGIVALSLKAVDSNYYKKSTDWHYYKEFNNLRGQINDNPNITLWGDKQTHIKNNLILSFLSDPKTIDIDHLKKTIEHSSSKSFLTKTSNLIQLSKYFIPVFLIALISFILIFRTKQKSFEYSIALLFFTVCILGITINASLKNRVFLSALTTILFLAPFLIKSNIKQTNKVLFFVLLVTSVYFSRQTVHFLIKNNNQYKTDYTAQQTLINDYLSDSKKTIIPYAADYKMELNNIFNITKSHKSGQLFFAGWAVNIPLNKTHFDSFSYFINGGGLFIKKQNVKRITQLISDHIFYSYGTKVTPTIILENTNDCIIEFKQTNDLTF